MQFEQTMPRDLTHRPEPRNVLVELAAAERMYDGAIPADLRAYILRGGRAICSKTPVAQARDRVRHCVGQVRLAQPGGRPALAWSLALARGWLRDALTAYRAAQARARSGSGEFSSAAFVAPRQLQQAIDELEDQHRAPGAERLVEDLAGQQREQPIP